MLSSENYTEHASKIGFCQRRAATEFKPACIAQLIQVALLMSQLRLAQIQGASLAYSRFLNHVRFSNCAQANSQIFSLR